MSDQTIKTELKSLIMLEASEAFLSCTSIRPYSLCTYSDVLNLFISRTSRVQTEYAILADHNQKLVMVTNLLVSLETRIIYSTE